MVCILLPSRTEAAPVKVGCAAPPPVALTLALDVLDGAVTPAAVAVVVVALAKGAADLAALVVVVSRAVVAFSATVTEWVACKC